MSYDISTYEPQSPPLPACLSGYPGDEHPSADVYACADALAARVLELSAKYEQDTKRQKADHDLVRYAQEHVDGERKRLIERYDSTW